MHNPWENLGSKVNAIYFSEIDIIKQSVNCRKEKFLTIFYLRKRRCYWLHDLLHRGVEDRQYSS